MPELPEVETTVLDLKKEVLGRTFLDIWTDFKKMIKKPASFEQFKNDIKRKRIEKIWRRGKNIIFDLSQGLSLLIHQKLTGHLLLGKWEVIKVKSQKSKVKSQISGPLEEPINQFIHLIFYLDNGWQLALSDLRKFAKVELLDQEELKKELSSFGPEPLEKDFTFEKFKEALSKKTTTHPPPSRLRRAPKGKIKQILMDQEVIAGIGNIYSDEILWQARIHPFKKIERLRDQEIKNIYNAMREILPKAIELGGESISDFRRLSGKRGGFDKLRKVYRQEGEKCSRCGAIIKRIKLAGRSAHFCPRCQKL